MKMTNEQNCFRAEKKKKKITKEKIFILLFLHLIWEMSGDVENFILQLILLWTQNWFEYTIFLVAMPG